MKFSAEEIESAIHPPEKKFVRLSVARNKADQFARHV
jgi:hypothetical protein